MKPRADSVLAQLTDEQQAQVYDWLQSLGYSETIKRVAAPAPDGFGIKTYRQSLHRFYLQYSEHLKSEHIQTAVTLHAGSPHGSTLAAGSEEAMHHAAFQFSTSPLDIDHFKELSRWITKYKSHDLKKQYLRIAEDHLALARERLALEREKFQFNAARQALLHHQKLGEILSDSSVDDESKIHAARKQLFGSDQLPS